jgi:hypothetical protein
MLGSWTSIILCNANGRRASQPFPNILHKPNGRRPAPQPSKRTSKPQSLPASQLKYHTLHEPSGHSSLGGRQYFSRKLDCGVWSVEPGLFSRLCHWLASALSRLALYGPLRRTTGFHSRLADSHYQKSAKLRRWLA